MVTHLSQKSLIHAKKPHKHSKSDALSRFGLFRFFLLCFIVVINSSCAGLHSQTSIPPDQPKPSEPLAKVTIAEPPVDESKKEIDAEKVVEAVMKTDPQPGSQPTEVEKPVTELGGVFGKTDFRGVLKTSYVKLKIVSLLDEEKTWTLVIGEKNSPPLPWSSQALEPGYFYINLPEGQYKFSSLSIPVGSTLAEETMDLYFEVKANKVIYLGTLQVIGTKERIKVGDGLPLFKPGFEYIVSVMDESEQGLTDFQQYYPTSPWPVIVELVGPRADLQATPSQAAP